MNHRQWWIIKGCHKRWKDRETLSRQGWVAAIQYGMIKYKEKIANCMHAIKFLKNERRYAIKVLKLLIKYYDAVEDARYKEHQGHNIGWDKVQEITDKIEDNYDLTEWEAK